MKRILMSLSVIAFVGVIAAGATGAFFSDTETSRGNTFTAGGLDLKIDSWQHYNGNECVPELDASGHPTGKYVWQGTNPYPVPGTPCDGTWTETDLKDGVHKFFNFHDIKPGDWGENTISLHVYDNDAWGKIHLKLGLNKDNDCTEPEGETEMKGVSSTTPPGVAAGCDDDGELYKNMVFETWLDQGMIPGFQCGAVNTPGRPRCPEDPYEGDNIWQNHTVVPVPVPNPTDPNHPGTIDVNVNEPMIPTEIVAMDLTGGTLPLGTGEILPPPGSNFRASFFDVFFDIDKSLMSQLGSTAGPTPEPCPVDGDGHYEYGRCHGISFDGHLVGSVTYYIGWHWKLPGLVGNEVQTDSLGGEMTFTAEQYRNNPTPAPQN